MTLDMKVLENGTRRKKPEYPTPRNEILLKDHAPTDLFAKRSISMLFKPLSFWIFVTLR